MSSPDVLGPMAGRVVALAENRFLDALANLFEKEGATALRIPLVLMLDSEDMAPVDAWITQASAGLMDLFVFMTGEGIRRLVARADGDGQKTAFVEGLSKSQLLTRGPKPVAALREIGLAPTLQAPAPTTDGLIRTLETLDLRGKTVGVQLHGYDNIPLIAAIEGAGARVLVAKPYRYAPASDGTRVCDMIHLMHKGAVDLLAFTSSPQVDRLFEVARENNLENELREGLKKTMIASIGPVASETLFQLGVRVDVCPEDGFGMKRLVQAISQQITKA